MMTAEQYKEMWAGMDKPARSSFINALREGRPSAGPYKETIKTLYYREYGRKIGSCINCLISAHFDIINGQIKGLKYMENKETKRAEAKYALRPGVVLYDRANRDVAKIATKDNLTDELALYHLATNPDCLKRFIQYPENWKDEATEYAKANGLRSYLLEEVPKPVERAETPKEGETPALSEGEKAKIAEAYEQTPVAKTGRPSEK